MTEIRLLLVYCASKDILTAKYPCFGSSRTSLFCLKFYGSAHRKIRLCAWTSFKENRIALTGNVVQVARTIRAVNSS